MPLTDWPSESLSHHYHSQTRCSKSPLHPSHLLSIAMTDASFYFLPSTLLRLLSPNLLLLSTVFTPQAPKSYPLSPFKCPHFSGSSSSFFFLPSSILRLLCPRSCYFLPPSLLWLLSHITDVSPFKRPHSSGSKVLSSFSCQMSSLPGLLSPRLFLLSTDFNPLASLS